ncbi:MAG: iron ABC transporter permease [Chloroflexi bacterium]|nr:iron ABC transporter permease [Chloroflexota bacterium]
MQAHRRPAPELEAPAAPSGGEFQVFRFPWRRLALALLAVAIACLLGLSLGSVPIPLGAQVGLLLGHLPLVNTPSSWPGTWDTILWDLRLPRVLGAALVGASLALAGGSYQGLLRNPLADPYLIGAAGGAALGATAVLVLGGGVSLLGFSPVTLAAFAGALLAVVGVYLLARSGSTAPVTTLVLAGVAVAFLTGAATTLLMVRASSDIRPVLFWMLGGLGRVGWREVATLLPYLALSTAVLVASGRLLNVLQLDEEQAAQLGVPVERLKLAIIAAASLATAAAVATAGIIGFVGLVAPHVVRLLWGPDYRALLPLSMAAGAAFLVLADLAARTLATPGEVPVGVVTAFAGAPFFLYLLRRAKREVF